MNQINHIDLKNQGIIFDLAKEEYYLCISNHQFYNARPVVSIVSIVVLIICLTMQISYKE